MAEVGENGEEGAHVEGDVEGEVVLEFPAKELEGDDEVARKRWEEIREAWA